jgi:hypothetical protein
MISRRIIIFAIIGLLTFALACGPRGGGATKEIKSGAIGRLTVTLANTDGVLRHGEQEFTITFKDAAGQPVDVGAAALTFHMPAMGPMAAMNDAAILTTTATPGVYHARAKIEMAGEWQAQVAYEGPAGTGKGSFPVMAQ